MIKFITIAWNCQSGIPRTCPSPEMKWNSIWQNNRASAATMKSHSQSRAKEYTAWLQSYFVCSTTFPFEKNVTVMYWWWYHHRMYCKGYYENSNCSTKTTTWKIKYHSRSVESYWDPFSFFWFQTTLFSEARSVFTSPQSVPILLCFIDGKSKTNLKNRIRSKLDQSNPKEPLVESSIDL